MFAPIVDGEFTRADRQAWLRRSLLAALPLSEARARAMVAHVTPHSFRPGLAGDLLQEGEGLESIMVQCRWHGQRVVRIYAERTSLSMTRRSDEFRFILA